MTPGGGPICEGPLVPSLELGVLSWLEAISTPGRSRFVFSVPQQGAVLLGGAVWG